MSIGNLTVTSSTFIGNTATEQGGAIYLSSSFGTQGTIKNTTIVGNSAATGGGVYITGDDSDIFNSIVVNNLTTNGTPDDVSGGTGLAESSYNLIGDAGSAGGLTHGANGNIVGVDWKAVLENDGTDQILQHNGGPTETIALIPGSPAIDAGSPPFLESQHGVPGTDQRNAPRAVNGGSGQARVDIGAFERQPFAALPVELVVTTLDDELDPHPEGDANDLSLREALDLANLQPGVDTVRFADGLSGRLTMSLGSLQITDDMSLIGPGPDVITIDAVGQSRIFTVSDVVPQEQNSVTISGLTLTRGSGNGLVGGTLVSDIGGAIYNVENLILSDTNITFNTANRFGGAVFNGATLTVLRSRAADNEALGGFGGGIFNSEFSTLDVIDSLVQGNVAGNGGGIANISQATIVNSTIVANGASNSAGGVWSRGPAAALKLTNSTVARNAVASNSTDFGGGLRLNASATIANSIVAGNYVNDTLAQDEISGSGSTIANSLIGDAATSGGAVHNQNGNIVGVDWQTVLDNDGTEAIVRVNGGLMPTIALIDGSPAIDAGDNALAVDGDAKILTSDQRGPGFARIFDGTGDGTATVDTGAFEFTALDFGDAPADYPVTLAQDGARHVRSALSLGALVDTEFDGQPDDLAGQGASGGDDNVDEADEDGVFVIASLVASTKIATRSSFAVFSSAAAEANGAGKVDAWIDFNQNGTWEHPEEQILNTVDVLKGLNILDFTVPIGVNPGDTPARFRISSQGGLTPTGLASDGEVEDYIATILDGDAIGGVAVEIEPPVAGVLEVVADESEVVVRTGTTELFRALGSILSRINIVGTDDDDMLNVGNLDAVFGGFVGGDANLGNDTLRFTGAEQVLDLTAIADTDLHGLEFIDITGGGDNSLTLNAAEVENMGSVANTLRIKANSGDTVLIGTGWTFNRNFVDDEDFVRELSQGAVILQSVGPSDWTYPQDPLDTTASGSVEPLDALRIINELNDPQFKASDNRLPDAGQASNSLSQFSFFDVNADGFVSPVDVIRIINRLNGVAGGEGEGASNLGTAYVATSPNDRGHFDSDSGEREEFQPARSHRHSDDAHHSSAQHSDDPVDRHRRERDKDRAENSIELYDAIDIFFRDFR